MEGVGRKNWELRWENGRRDQTSKDKVIKLNGK